MTKISLSILSTLHSFPCVGRYFPLPYKITEASYNQSTFPINPDDLPAKFSDEEMTILKKCDLATEDGQLKLGEVSCSAIACAFIQHIFQIGHGSLDKLRLDPILKQGILAYIAQTKTTLQNLKEINTCSEGFSPQREHFYLETLHVPTLPTFEKSLQAKKLAGGNILFSTSLKMGQEISIYQNLVDSFLSNNTDSLQEIGDRACALLTLTPGTYAIVFEKNSSDHTVYFFDSHGDPGDKKNPATVKEFETISDFIEFLSKFHPYNDAYDTSPENEVRNKDLNRIGFCILKHMEQQGGSGSFSQKIAEKDTIDCQHSFSSSDLYGSTNDFLAKKALLAIGLLFFMYSVNIGLKKWSFAYFPKAGAISSQTHFYSKVAGVVSALILMNRADWEKYIKLVKTARIAIFA